MAMRDHDYEELVFQIIRYANDQMAQNHLDKVLDLGFTLEEASQIGGLTLTDAKRLCQYSQHFVKALDLDHECFLRILQRINDEKSEEEKQDALIMLGAPHAMMQTLFGMNGHEYAKRRKCFSKQNTGRPRVPSDEEQKTVYRVWQSNRELAPVEMWLTIGQTLDIDLSLVWSLVKSWEKLYKSPKGAQPNSMAGDKIQQGICARKFG